MVRPIAACLMPLLLVGVIAVSASISHAAEAEKPQHALDFKMKTIDGGTADLNKYRGKVVLIVNVASECGNTPQYEGLQAIYEKYQDKGLVVLGFPANQFGLQEPGTDAEIKQFCSTEYGVSFPMFSKIEVKGDGAAPLYQYLTSQETEPVEKGVITWNFEKFLIGRDGKVAARFSPSTEPDSPEVIKAIEAELASK